MPIPTTLESLSTTAASNSPSGSEQRTLADDGLRQAYAFIKQVVSQGSDIASASTITPASTGYQFDVTGTTSITTIASTNSWDGRLIALQFDGALTLTHSSTLYLPGAANITTAAGDVALFLQRSSGSWQCISYSRKSGNVTINATSSGAALTIGYPTGYKGLYLGGDGSSDFIVSLNSTANTTGRVGIEFARSGGTAKSWVIGNDTDGGTDNSFDIRDLTRSVIPFSIGTSGNVTINAPSSGTALAVTSVSGARIAQFIGASGSAAFVSIVDGKAGTREWQLNVGNSTTGSFEIRDSTAAADRLSITSAGNVTLYAPASGYAFNIPTQTPASAGASGTTGDISWDSSYVYVCTATNTWKRAAISTW